LIGVQRSTRTFGAARTGLTTKDQRIAPPPTQQRDQTLASIGKMTAAELLTHV
jgi:hypothetical protein